jgi:hypothetical protein
MKDLKGKAGVYQFINKKDPSKSYVGSSINLSNRIQTHIALGNNLNYTYVSLLYRSVQKNSWDSFKLVILEFTSNVKDNIITREQYYLDLYRPYYNILTEAGSSQGATLSESTKAKLSEAKGTTVYMYSSDSMTLIDTFSSINKATTLLNMDHRTMVKYIHNMYVYKNKWIFSFTLLEPGFKPLEYINKGLNIYVYKDSKFFRTFDSAILAAKFFGVYYTSILRYAKDNTLFQNIYIFSLTPLPQESLPALFKRIKKSQSITIYLYSYDPKSTEFQLISSFSSASTAAEYLNTSGNRVLRYARSHHVLNDKYILSLEPLTSDFQPSLGVVQPGIKGTTIYLYSLDYQKLETFYSLRNAGNYLKINHSTVLKYARSNSILKNQYILSFEEFFHKIPN